MTDWLATLLDGSVGGVVGALGAFGSAVWVVKRQSKADRAMAREEREADNAMAAVAVLMEQIDTLENERMHADSVELTKLIFRTISESQRRIMPVLPLLPPSISQDLVRAIADKQENLASLREYIRAHPDKSDVEVKITQILDDWYERLKKSTSDIMDLISLGN